MNDNPITTTLQKRFCFCV